jgi:hypothetical protein
MADPNKDCQSKTIKNKLLLVHEHFEAHCLHLGDAKMCAEGCSTCFMTPNCQESEQSSS